MDVNKDNNRDTLNPPEALTFDDILLVPQYSDLTSRREADTTSWLTPEIKLTMPIISANMDSVTEAEMAIKMALGTKLDGAGMGFIHRFNSIEQQVALVEKVKRYRSYIIENPYTILATDSIATAEELMDDKGIGGLLVTDPQSGVLTGIVTRRDIYSEPKDKLVADVFTPRQKMIVATYQEMKELDKIDKARELMHQAKVEKLPLVDEDDRPVGLIVMKDIRKLEDYPRASVNERGNLLVGAAIGVVGDHLERAEALVNAGCDVIVSDVAHAHHVSVKNSIQELKKKYPDIPVVGGTIATADGFRYLAEVGADSIAVGVGSGCFAAGTRVLMGNGSYKNIEDIQAGDYVINKNGQSVKVNKAWMTGHKEVIKLRHTQSAEATYVTPDHRYWVADYAHAPAYVSSGAGGVAVDEPFVGWRSIQDFQQAVLMAPNEINYDWEDNFTIAINDQQPTTNQEIKSSYDLGFIFASFLTGGSSDAEHKLTWRFENNKSQSAAKLTQAIERTFGKAVVLKQTDNESSVYLESQWAQFFTQFTNQDEKNLPDKFLVNNLDYLQGLFDGLVDFNSPGSASVEVSSTSQSVRELFAILTQKLYGSFPAAVSDSSKQILQANLDGQQVDEDNQLIKISEVSPTRMVIPVYDIEVDCPTHSFIADNVIVHNSICSTRLIAGHGMPQLQALYECYQVQQEEYPDISIIADGGIRKPADFDKAMIFANLVKMGSMLAGTPESPGEVTRNDKGQDVKIYRGMASKEAFEAKLEAEGVSDRMKRSANYTPEGIQVEIPTKPPVQQLLSKFSGGLRSAMSYTGARTLDEYQRKVKMVRITNPGLTESDTHIRSQT